MLSPVISLSLSPVCAARVKIARSLRPIHLSVLIASRGLGLHAGQERGLRFRCPLDRDGLDLGDGVQLLGCPGGMEGHDGLDRSQPQVAGSCPVTALGLQVIQEREHGHRINIGDLELVRGDVPGLGQEAKEQAPRVTVGADRCIAHGALCHQICREVLLQHRRKRCHHDRSPISEPCSRRRAARAATSGAACRYQ